jgi:signal transduction histidine kinase
MPKPKPNDPSKRGDADKLKRAGKLLHDEIAPLLSAAGLKLHLLSMDFPDAEPMAVQATAILEEAMDRVRELSRELSPPPDYSKLSSVTRRSEPVKASRRERK